MLTMPTDLTVHQKTWRPLEPEWGQPLGLTLEKPGQGSLGFSCCPWRWYPACSKHGAMNRVAPELLWRCLMCNIGMELDSDGWELVGRRWPFGAARP